MGTREDRAVGAEHCGSSLAPWGSAVQQRHLPDSPGLVPAEMLFAAAAWTAAGQGLLLSALCCGGLGDLRT